MGQLKVIERNDQRVLTTAQLATVYGTDYKSISKNFSRNKDRYTEGKHYIVLQGYERAKFLQDYRQIDDSSNHLEFHDSLKHAKIIYLWTAKGALLHAKSLGTDQAWNAYEQLVDDYFQKVEQIQRANIPTKIPSTIEDILELAVVNMKDLRKEIQETREENHKLSLIVNNSIFLDDHQKAEIQEAVKKRVGYLMKKGYEPHFQSIYSALKVFFTVPKYDKILRKDFNEAMDFVNGWYPKKSEENA